MLKATQQGWGRTRVPVSGLPVENHTSERRTIPSHLTSREPEHAPGGPRVGLVGQARQGRQGALGAAPTPSTSPKQEASVQSRHRFDLRFSSHEGFTGELSFSGLVTLDSPAELYSIPVPRLHPGWRAAIGVSKDPPEDAGASDMRPTVLK